MSADGAPAFTPITVKANPFQDLYKAPAAGEDPGIAALRGQFQAELVGARMDELVAVDRGGMTGNPEPAADLFAQLGVAFANRFNGFESSARPQHNPQFIATPELKDKIQQKLSQSGIGNACELTPDHVLNRAGAMTCAGCHRFTAGAAVAKDVLWPSSLDFVHINETGKLSDALEQFFLPARQRNLARHLQTPPPPAAPAASEGPSVLAASRAIRQKVATVPAADSRLTAITTLSDVERQVQAARAAEQATPGAFVSVRRPH